ncbi:MAG: hypothetical protein H0T84_11645 [Tatlockia sp.]|nr:hypothetical protein [Tatlockia sp.]
MKKIISVFFSGTGFNISDTDFLAGSLYKRTKENETQIKLGFDGCGVVYGLRGGLFAHGLDEQCDEVIQRINQEITDGHEVTLNIYGHSRGGTAAAMLAAQLSLVDPRTLSINMAILDPVPGNLISPSTLDPFKTTLANKTMDLRDCRPLKKVLALYPFEPLSDFAFHAPLFISYPKHTEVEEDAMPGCHAEAEQIGELAGKITQLRVDEFFAKNGTVFEGSSAYLDDIELLQKDLVERYQRQLNALRYADPITRDGHSAKGMYINVKIDGDYFNQDHKRRAGGDANATVAVTLEQSNNPFSILKRAITAHPIAWQFLKWTVISLILGTILFFSGGLGAIPVVGLVVAKLGIASLFIAAPILGAAMAGLWYGAIKPLSLWTVNKLFYPKYSLREIEPQAPVDTLDSPVLLNKIFSVDKEPRPEPQKPYQGNDVLSRSINETREIIPEPNASILDLS